MRTHTNFVSFAIALIALLLIGLACGSSKPAPPAYVGHWTGDDGSTITIRADGGADYRSGGTKVTGGSAVIDEGAKTLKISLAGLGPSFTIDKAPSGGQMTLSGVVYRKGGNSDTTTDTKTTDKKPEVPSEEKLQTLVKTTFMDFGDAVQAEDFSDFHKKTAKVWRESTDPGELLDAFKVFVDNKADYNFKRAVSPLEATFTPSPSIEDVKGLDALVVKGYYPTTPQRANFELKYVMDDGTWKLISINIRTRAE